MDVVYCSRALEKKMDPDLATDVLRKEKIDRIDTEGMIVSRTTTRSDREQLLASWHLPLGEGEARARETSMMAALIDCFNSSLIYNNYYSRVRIMN